MTHQVSLTVITEIEDVGPLKDVLGSIHGNHGKEPIVAFGRMPTLHFARFFVMDEAKDLRGRTLAPKLAYLANVDAPLDAHLEGLADLGSDGLDSIYQYCKGYPAPGERTRESRLAYLRRHQVRTQAFYANGIGRTVEQIRQEEDLRQKIESFLDRQGHTESDPVNVRAAIQDYVRGEPSLDWARSPAARPSMAWRLGQAVDLVSWPLLALLLSPLILIALPLFLIVLRRHEETDQEDDSGASEESILRARADEDFGVQNQVIAIGSFKPGPFRLVLTVIVLRLTQWTTHHLFVDGALSGLRTIHFARWVRVDGYRRLFFTSNYDGSLESYQDDFIDKAASGLNAIFSSGDGFPYTRYLACIGIRDEQKYKRFLPTRQVPSQVWYSAYPQLSVINVNNNAQIRKDLFSRLRRSETEEWLRRL
jgi:hypothetical protein